MSYCLRVSVALAIGLATIGSGFARAQVGPPPISDQSADQPRPDTLLYDRVRNGNARAAEDAKVGDRRDKGDIGNAAPLERLETRIRSRLSNRLEQRLTRAHTVVELGQIEELARPLARPNRLPEAMPLTLPPR